MIAAGTQFIPEQINVMKMLHMIVSGNTGKAKHPQMSLRSLAALP
jgi:hypothetical protein